MRSPLALFIFLAIMLALDTYFYLALRTVSQNLSPRAKLIITIVYWSVTLLSIIGLLLFILTEQEMMGKGLRTYIFGIIMGLFLAKLAAVAFFITDDLRRGIQWFVVKIFSQKTVVPSAGAGGISRSVFLSWMGIAAGTTLFGSLLYGFSNKYNYDLRRLRLSFPDLPPAFQGLKIVHISDIHSGSLLNHKAVEHGVNMILKEKADLVLFTGDLVNDRATEMKSLQKLFSQLKAPLGVYSTLGNHDYGDYASWPHEGVSKTQNLEDLKKVHAVMGWRLLMNEHVILKKGDDEIAVLGIENWGAKGRFPKYGKMQEAYPGTEKVPFKILMSHDPSHWDAQVRPEYPDVDLMLAGHTHGMQFGIETPGFKWSPVQYMYKQWAGLYEEGKQKLYVNRGFGFIGYPGRVGILPEITVIELSTGTGAQEKVG